MKRPLVLVLAPSREAVSGVATHVNTLFASRLAARFELVHFQIGSEGRGEEGLARKLARLVLSPLALGATIVKNDAAVVHINTSLNAKSFWRDLVYLLIAKLCGARVLYQVHGGSLAEFRASSLILDLVLRRAANWPDMVVVLSQAELAAWRECAPQQCVETVPNGIDCAPFVRYNRAAPDAKQTLRLIYLGRLAPRKGLLETIEALRLVRARGVAARLVIAGSGPEEARLRQHVRDCDLMRDVAFVGGAYGEHKARLLAHADALVLASYTEGLPYALLEAMAAGVVPIVTPVGGIPDAVVEGEHGVFVEPRDAHAIAQAILRLNADRSALARMSAACRRRVAAAYSIERVAKDFSSLYWGLCASRAPKTVL